MEPQYNFSDKYIGLPTPLDISLPGSILVQEEELVLKDEFHMSIHCILNTKEANPEISHDEIINHFNNFVKDNPIELVGFKSEFRFCKQNDRRTVVAMVETKNLEEYFDDFNNLFKTNTPTQPAHITLYTKQPNVGIGLTSQSVLEELSKEVFVPGLEEVFKTTKKG